MGYYSEYLNEFHNFDLLSKERKNLMETIADIRGRPLLTYAVDMNKTHDNIFIEYSDLTLFKDQISNIDCSKDDAIDVILETPGGSGEIVEDIISILRHRFNKVSFIIPGAAKSAGTIMVMSGDEILMGPYSSLGPIDAQIFFKGRTFSADAFLESFNKIKEECDQTGKLHMVYIPTLSNMNIGELQSARNAKSFAIELVKEWLVKYKFKTWVNHSSNGKPVTSEEKVERAKEIAQKLSSHQEWRTHGRSIKLKNLQDMRLQVDDYSKNKELDQAINRYYTLLQLTFEYTAIYKLVETKKSQIYRFSMPHSPPHPHQQNNQNLICEVKCNKCGEVNLVHIRKNENQKLQPGAVAFPKNNILICKKCKIVINLSPLRMQIEAQTKKRIV